MDIYTSPNHGGKRPSTTGIILHSTRSGVPGKSLEYQRTIGYMMKPDTVSSHRVIGYNKGQHAQLVDDDLIAFHAAIDNAAYLGVEMCQPLIDDYYSRWQVETTLAVCVEWCRKYGIVPGADTLVPHSGTEQGKAAGKSDPGFKFDYEDFMKRLKEAISIN